MRTMRRLALVVAVGIGFWLPGISIAVAAGPEEPDIAAESAIVVDATSGEVLYTRDASLRLPPASLTKIITAFVAIESTAPDTLMPVAESDLIGEASMGLSAGESLPFETLLYGLLLPSGNDAAMTVARNVSGSVDQFVAHANDRLAQLGLPDTHLANPHGLDADDHYSSARDLASVTLYALQHEPMFQQVSSATEYTGNGHELYQTNDLHVTYPGLIAGKTGVTDAAGNCLMEVAERDGRRVIVVLLGSTADAWYADAETLLDYGFATLATPGRLSSFDHITFPEPTTAAGTSIESTVLSTTGSPSSSLGTVVSAAGVAGEPRRAPWIWPMTAALAIGLFSLAALQVQRVLELASLRTMRRRARQSPARSPRRAGSDAPFRPWTTQPYAVSEPRSASVSRLHDRQTGWVEFTAEQEFTAEIPFIPAYQGTHSLTQERGRSAARAVQAFGD